MIATDPTLGRLPVLVDGDMTLFESGVILLYLGETYGGLDTAEKRYGAASWVSAPELMLSHG